MRPIKLWTIQLGQWRVAEQHGIFLLDITAKSGKQAFAPVYATVMAYKRGEVSQPDYTKEYLAKMAESRVLYPRTWESLGKRPALALACYCPAGVYCHRRLFVDVVQEYLSQSGIQSVACGELTKESVV